MLRRSRSLAALLALGSCTYLSGDPEVVVTSTPAGAEVLLDGQPTGRTTPAKLDLGGIAGGDHVIELRKRGFEAEARRVYHYTTGYTSRWIDGVTDLALPSAPFFWTLGDVFTPLGVRWRYVPHELHVRLYEEGRAPVSTTGRSPPQGPR